MSIGGSFASPGSASADERGPVADPKPSQPRAESPPSVSALPGALPLVAPRRTLAERFPDGPPQGRSTDNGRRALEENRRGRIRYMDPMGRFVVTVHPDGRTSFRNKVLSLRHGRMIGVYDLILLAQGKELHQTAKRAFMRDTYQDRLRMRTDWTITNLRDAERRLWGELREIWEDESKTRFERELIIAQRWAECDVDVDLTPVDGEVSVVDYERRTVARRARRTIAYFTQLHIDPRKPLGKNTPARDEAVALAPDLFEACERDARTCIRVGDLLVGRRANAFDATRGARHYAKGCDASDPWACYELAILHYLGLGVERDDRRSAELHKVACEAGVPDGCAYLVHLHRKGFGVQRSADRAVYYGERACAHGLEDFC